MCRVLIVDDEAPMRRMLAALLATAGVEIKTACSAAEACQKLKEEQFELVLTDLRMEAPLAGYDVVQAVHQLAPRPRVAILTAFPVSPAEWKRAGADALFVKGTSSMALIEFLREAVAAHALSMNVTSSGA